MSCALPARNVRLRGRGSGRNPRTCSRCLHRISVCRQTLSALYMSPDTAADGRLYLDFSLPYPYHCYYAVTRRSFFTSPKLTCSSVWRRRICPSLLRHFSPSPLPEFEALEGRGSFQCRPCVWTLGSLWRAATRNHPLNPIGLRCATCRSCHYGI